MRDAIYQQLDRWATLPIFLVATALFGLCSLAFYLRGKELVKRAGGKPIKTFDSRCWYTSDEARDLLETMGDSGRRFYAKTEVSLDLLFPLVYGSWFTIAIFRLYGDPGYLLLVPLITVIADLLENFSAAYMAWTYKGSVSPIVWAATRFTAIKRSGFIMSGVLVVAGIAIWLWRGRKASA